MKFSEWLDDQMSFWLYPLMEFLNLLRELFKLFEMLSMGFVIMTLYLILWVVVGDESIRRNDSLPRGSFHSTMSLGTLPTDRDERSLKSAYEGYPPVYENTGGSVPAHDVDGRYIDFFGDLDFCGKGRIFFSRSMQNAYWDHWYERKVGWLYRHYMIGSLNAEALRYVVGELKAGRTPDLSEDDNYIDRCPGEVELLFGKLPYHLVETRIPKIEVEWHVGGTSDIHSPEWPEITGYCLKDRCDSADFFLHINRWGDTFAFEPPYSEGQKEANRVFDEVGTLSFWEEFAQDNGLDPHSVDKYWKQNQTYVKNTVNFKKAHTKEIMTPQY